jgi:hypothetical protein
MLSIMYTSQQTPAQQKVIATVMFLFHTQQHGSGTRLTPITLSAACPATAGTSLSVITAAVSSLSKNRKFALKKTVLCGAGFPRRINNPIGVMRKAA